MGKILIIKDADFSLNAIGNVEYESPESGGTPRIRILWSQLAMELSTGTPNKSPFVYYVPNNDNYTTVAIAAVDISRVVGATIIVRNAASVENGYAFISDTSDLGTKDIANIQNWHTPTWDSHGAFKANYFTDRCVSMGTLTPGIDNTFTVPEGAKWLIFCTRDPDKTLTSVTANLL